MFQAETINVFCIQQDCLTAARDSIFAIRTITMTESGVCCKYTPVCTGGIAKHPILSPERA